MKPDQPDASAALVARLRPYLWHKPDCHHATDPVTGELLNAYRILGPCDCGLEAALAALGVPRPLLKRVSKGNNAVRYILDGHDETLAFSTNSDAVKFWDVLRRYESAALGVPPPPQMQEKNADTHTRAEGTARRGRSPYRSTERRHS